MYFEALIISRIINFHLLKTSEYFYFNITGKLVVETYIFWSFVCFLLKFLIIVWRKLYSKSHPEDAQRFQYAKRRLIFTSFL